MAQIQQLKRRMRSIANTMQITKAMELVAASKMRRAQESALKSRPYANSAREILAHLAKLAREQGATHPLFTEREVTRRLMIVFTSDRGLAGAYNSNVLRLFARESAAASTRGEIVSAIAVGQKAVKFVSRLEDIKVVGAYHGWSTQPTPEDLSPIARTARELFEQGEIDAVDIVSTAFQSSLNQVARTRRFLPINAAELLPEGAIISESIREATFEPTVDDVLTQVVPQFLIVQLLQSAYEATASEHSMRMMAMKSASDNAKELKQDLQLTYNSARQAAITQELSEITSGAEAIL